MAEAQGSESEPVSRPQGELARKGESTEAAMKNTQQFIVRVDMPADVSSEEMRDYIRAAVKSWKGGAHPDDAIYYLDQNSVTVRPVPKPKPPPTVKLKRK